MPPPLWVSPAPRLTSNPQRAQQQHCNHESPWLASGCVVMQSASPKSIPPNHFAGPHIACWAAYCRQTGRRRQHLFTAAPWGAHAAGRGAEPRQITGISRARYDSSHVRRLRNAVRSIPGRDRGGAMQVVERGCRVARCVIAAMAAITPFHGAAAADDASKEKPNPTLQSLPDVLRQITDVGGWRTKLEQ